MSQKQTVRMKAPFREQREQTIKLPQDNTVKMVPQNQQKTLRMATGQPIEHMNQADGTINGYIQTGDILDGKYELTINLTYNTGEAALFVSQYEEKQFVAKVYFQGMNPKQEVTDRIRAIQSSHVIPILDYGVDKKSKRYYEIFPYYKQGDLTKTYPHEPDYILNVIAPAINEGLRTLHSVGVFHRDIKPNNIFQDGESIIIGDFGISSTKGEGSVIFTNNANRTNGYAAPEVYNQLICEESDYYSFGITLLELALGENPFKHLNTEQIIKMTLMDQIDVPSMIPKKLAHLIKGLTRKDRNNRWGHEEVKKWLNGEHVIVIEDLIHRNIRPYRFEGRDFTSLEELAIAFAAHWEEAKKHLYNGLVKNFVKQFGEEYELVIIECEKQQNQDIGLFQLICGLHPNPSLCWKGHTFRDLNGLGSFIHDSLPQVNEDISDLLKSGVLMMYLERIEAEKENPSFYNEAKKIYNEAQRNSLYGYYLLGFLLKNINEFCFQKMTFTNLDDLILYLGKQSDAIDALAAELLENQYFFAWLSHMGYEEHIAKWRSII
ncbi:protein kinase [Bacillus sp. DTU_2020_1000418_1_SI_GHA_SEK_038]|uniref:protein kinase domain-containing protein n=1 Tax=Bacillus sp. DTU_2020_1000418_1_SI_GHA_SEK_038 TaxID=3077585 RepID=UPI0028EB9DD8|nr:protein kinase [Bacillus sp. DTU_2020_1000418_1_SI_GHA_SEK_038]WNS77421.1 protein kinase [Bacillus sp. DTU_2020_1000418_1_SI_GHA_SEK_038]